MASETNKHKQVANQITTTIKPNMETETPLKVAKKTFKLCKENYPELKSWTFKVSRAKTRFGQCNYTNKIISVSPMCLKEPREKIIDTVVHEVAHALNPKCNHNWKWKQTFIELGGTGNRCGAYSAKTTDEWFEKQNFKYIVECPNGCTLGWVTLDGEKKELKKWGFHKKVRPRICGGCKETIHLKRC